MDVSNLLSHEAPHHARAQQMNEDIQQQQQHRSHQYPTRHSMSTNTQLEDGRRFTTPPAPQGYTANNSGAPSPYNVSPASPTPKNVAFELLFDGAPNYRARLPMRVQIFPHDTTDSIVTTVKNFYGLYEGAAKGVSFEDAQGNTLIARYENFRNNMVVHVRVIPDYSQPSELAGYSNYQYVSPVAAHKGPHLDEPLQMLPPQPAQALTYGQPPSRPGSRVARKRSVSPHSGRGRRSASAQKGRSRSAIKSRGSSVHRSMEEINSDTINGYSSSDGGAGSVTGSRKARSEQLASAEISTTNIVEGNRRKRAKFESSELPLFVPPQVPAPNSISSVSPQRRSNGQDNPSPFARPTQRTFTYTQPLQSPQSYGYGDQAYGNAQYNGTGYAVPPTAQHGHRLRDRSNGPNIGNRSSTGSNPRLSGAGILPTPDPTIASCISDEDVALQLMRLGDASNFSHGRTSASTLDDALSGRADAASSATSESGDESDATEQPSLPPLQPKLEYQSSIQTKIAKSHYKHLNDIPQSFDSTEPSGDEVDGDYDYDEKKDGVFKSDPDDLLNEFGQAVRSKSSSKPKALVQNGVNKSRRSSSAPKAVKGAKPRPAGAGKKAKALSLSTASKTPISPASLPPPSRKTSSTSTLNFQHQLGVDEEDLSSKPRCQRCRKSKKGCDRQRPCQRCKDAGIGVEGCVSEDEGSNRKGRYGRHMGVPVKKGMEGDVPDGDSETAGAILTGMAGVPGSPDKSKKRKR